MFTSWQLTNNICRLKLDKHFAHIQVVWTSTNDYFLSSISFEESLDSFHDVVGHYPHAPFSTTNFGAMLHIRRVVSWWVRWVTWSQSLQDLLGIVMWNRRFASNIEKLPHSVTFASWIFCQLAEQRTCYLKFALYFLKMLRLSHVSDMGPKGLSCSVKSVFRSSRAFSFFNDRFSYDFSVHPTKIVCQQLTYASIGKSLLPIFFIRHVLVPPFT